MLGISTSYIPQAAGLLGVVLYVGSYAALQTGLLRSNGYAYAAANLVAASLVFRLADLCPGERRHSERGRNRGQESSLHVHTSA